jgi:hypothetical protein
VKVQLRRALILVSGAMLLFGSSTSCSRAQIGALGGTAGPALVEPPATIQRANPFEPRGREYAGLPVGDWLLFPSLFVGALVDDNVNQSSTSRTSSAGARVVPSLFAEANDGIHKTTLYGMLDGRLYAEASASNADAVAARSGVIQTYEATRDLIFRGQADYTRQRDLFSTLGVDHSVTSLNPTGVGLSPTVNPQTYNQFSGSASVQKTLDRAFVSLTGSVVDIVYDGGGTQPSPDGVVYTASGRGGFWFTPLLYAYAEPTVDQRRYATTIFNSQGYRAVGGIGSDQIGLFRGEVYGGYQAEQFDLAPLGSVSSTVLGARLSYYPTRALTLRASVDESLGVTSLAPSPGVSSGTPTRLTTSLLQASYTIAPEWSANARFGYIRTQYVNNPRLDNAWTVGGTIEYSIWRNVNLTLDYQYTQLTSNAPGQNFSRNVGTLGAVYRY